MSNDVSLKSSIQGWYLTLLPGKVWKRQFRSQNKRTGWIPRGWLLAVFLDVLYWSLWTWCFRWPTVSWKELLHPGRVKNNIGDTAQIILWLADARKQSVAASDLSPPAQRRMSEFGNDWQDFCCWGCLWGSCLAEHRPVATRVQQAWGGSANIAGLGMITNHLKQTVIWICFYCFH